MRCALGRGDRETPWARVRAARRVAVMDLQLTDKVAVVTGASKGIGLAVVRELAVNVASVNAFFEPDGAVVDYGAAKAALLNVAKALSQELATLVAPLASPRTANVTGSDYVIDGGLIKTM